MTFFLTSILQKSTISNKISIFSATIDHFLLFSFHLTIIVSCFVSQSHENETEYFEISVVVEGWQLFIIPWKIPREIWFNSTVIYGLFNGISTGGQFFNEVLNLIFVLNLYFVSPWNTMEPRGNLSTGIRVNLSRNNVQHRGRPRTMFFALP